MPPTPAAPRTVVSRVDTEAYAGDQPQLKRGALTMIESLGQSVANIAPTLTPALKRRRCRRACRRRLMDQLSGRDHRPAVRRRLDRDPGAAASPLRLLLRLYRRTLGPMAGMLTGWAMIAAYLMTAVAVLLSMSIFLNNALTACGLASLTPPTWALTIVVSAVVLLAVYRDIKLSSRIGLLQEAVSIAIAIGLIALVVWRHGTVVRPHTSVGQSPDRKRNVLADLRGVQLRRLRKRRHIGQGNA